MRESGAGDGGDDERLDLALVGFFLFVVVVIFDGETTRVFAFVVVAVVPPAGGVEDRLAPRWVAERRGGEEGGQVGRRDGERQRGRR